MTIKSLAFIAALLIAAFGFVGLVAPAIPVGLAHHAATAGVFYIIAAIRVAFGLLLISVAPSSRAPRTIRILGWIILIAGIITAITGTVAIDQARTMIEWWTQQGTALLRLTGAILMVFGGFIAWACAPARHSAAPIAP
jgi:uncharacterized membrane protein YwaF